MVRSVFLVVVSMLVGCGGKAAPAPEPAGATAAPATPPTAKRAPCTFGADQTCNGDPRISSFWGRCTEHGTCECNPGFELSPTGYCQPQQQK